MGKFAILIGIGEYSKGLENLHSSTNDAVALAEVLQHPEISGFNVQTLLNPTHEILAQTLEIWFLERTSEDTCVVFFSGHGLKDERRNLYFCSTNTRKFKNRLVTTTALAARNVYEWMNSCKSKRQVIILDCCFSGAFGDATTKGYNEIDLQQQLIAQSEGRVVLTSTNSVDYAFEQKGSNMSVYTHYLVEGLSTGAADLNNDGKISVDELHYYAKRKVQEEAPAMEPQIISLKEGDGYRIVIAEPIVSSVILLYRKEVERIAQESNGKLLYLDRALLDELKKEHSLSNHEAIEIENEVLQPYRQLEEKIERYKHYFGQTIQLEYPLGEDSRKKLDRLLQTLRIRPEDVSTAELEILNERKIVLEATPGSQRSENPEKDTHSDFLLYKKEEVLNCIDKIYKILHDLDIKKLDIIKEFEQLIQSNVSKMLVLGDFGCGKSQLINALLGAEVLPCAATPMRKPRTEVKWSAIPKAFLHYEEDNPSRTEIPVDDINSYLLPAHEWESSIYSKIELFWPLRLLLADIELIELEGQNTIFNDRLITSETIIQRYGSEVNSIIFITSCDCALTQKQRELIDGLILAGYQDIFLVCSKFDRIREGDKEEIKAHVLNTMEHKIERERIFFISAVDALEGRLDGDREMVSSSGLLELKKALENFVVAKIEKMKLLRAIIKMKIFIYDIQLSLSEIMNSIQSRDERKILQASLDEQGMKLSMLISEIESQTE